MLEFANIKCGKSRNILLVRSMINEMKYIRKGYLTLDNGPIRNHSHFFGYDFVTLYIKFTLEFNRLINMKRFRKYSFFFKFIVIKFNY